MAHTGKAYRGPLRGDAFLHHASGERFRCRGPELNAQVIVYRDAVGPSGRDWVLQRTATGSYRDADGHGYAFLGAV